MNLYKEAIDTFGELFRQAAGLEPSYPEAMTAATVDDKGFPHNRVVLLKEFDERGFVFYTNMASQKGQQLSTHPFAALTFHWKSMERQVHIEGTISHVSDEEADAYFGSRPRDSQIGAWASLQSQKLPDRQTLLDRVQQFTEKFAGAPVPRPPHWSGYRLKPQRFEFWKAHEYRLHERMVYEENAGGWLKYLLYP